MKKILLALLLAFVLLTALAVSVNAEETAPAPQTGESETAEGAEIAETEAPEKNANFFDELYEKLEACRSDLFSLLSFLASSVCLLFCRKGVFPFLEKGVGAISSSALRIREESEKQNAACQSIADSLSEDTALVVQQLKNFSDRLPDLKDLLARLPDETAAREKLNAVLLSQVDLLSEIFYASSLPQYRKDEIGERVRAMKALLQPQGDSQ